MSAFRRIFSLELRALRRDRTLLTALGIFLFCAAYSLHCGHGWQVELRRSAQRIEERDRDLLTKQREILRERERTNAPEARGFYDPSHPGAVGVFGGRNAVLPPSDWALLSVGQTDLVPQATLVTTQHATSLQEGIDTQSPLLLLLGRFDLVFVIVVLYPLLVLALAHDLICRERERGRLALMISLSTSSALLLGARGLARAMPLLAIGIAASCVGFALAQGGGESWSGDGLRLLLWCLLVAAYGAVWFSLGTLVSVCSRRAATSAPAVLGSWLLWVVLIPSGYDAVVGWMVPLPSRAEHAAIKRDRQREAEEQADALLAGYLRDHPELAASDTDDAMMSFMPRYLAATEAVERELAPLQAAFDAARQAQQRLAHRYRFVSPSLVLQSSLCDLAGTGPERHALFAAATRDFQAAWRSFFLPRAFAGRRLTSADFDQIPDFRMREDPILTVLGRVAPSLFALIAMALLFTLIAARRAQSLSLAEDR